MKFILFASIFLIFTLIILYNIGILSKFEYMNNYYYDFYLVNFNRVPDTIIKTYFMNLDEKVIETELNIYYNQVKKGEIFVSKKKIILCGLIRNAKENIPFLKLFYEKIKKICLEVAIQKKIKKRTRGKNRSISHNYYAGQNCYCS